MNMNEGKKNIIKICSNNFTKVLIFILLGWFSITLIIALLPEDM
ncbi:DNA-directed RNA polymerase II subunit D [Babesia microti strain RI]|uniref:DNA-directed RNA polymerase II subunit D n=1 Tax=Babesia microti (strain RI) TaxID=1133968 RepID=A0A1R4ABQ3_BABMR|nr:DNA-directed RNA polymerase II subunit D [Babesia microti strain RI]SJK86447.1 DNA-directed RNA polymerase II subunit D [Babesia microti strain RI]|eukprot:XP_021338604.1 DNA-directed RNA polymerase II subunit D [Babesia microti strain RI]